MSTTTITLRDALKQIGVNQDTGELRIKGTGDAVDLDQRIIVAADGIPEISSYAGDVDKWEKGTLKVGSASIEVGWQVLVGDIGTLLTYALNKEADNFYLMPFYKFSESGTVKDLRIHRLVGDANQITAYNVGTTNLNATLISGTYTIAKEVTTTNSLLNWKQRIRVGTTAPTEPVKFSVYEDTDGDDINKKIIEMWIPVSEWSGKSPGDYITFYYTGAESKKTPIQISDGTTYYVMYESEVTFSLYGDGSAPEGATIGQAYVEDSLITDNVEFLTATGGGTLEHTHTAMTHYISDTTLNKIELNIPYNITSSFKISDAAHWFTVNDFKVNILNQAEEVVHTATLDSYNKSYYFFYNEDDSYWYYHLEGIGEVVKIGSDHSTSVDFCCNDILNNIPADATSRNVGMFRYRTEASASHCEMCMQTGASTYAWTAIKTNSW